MKIQEIVFLVWILHALMLKMGDVFVQMHLRNPINLMECVNHVILPAVPHVNKEKILHVQDVLIKKQNWKMDYVYALKGRNWTKKDFVTNAKLEDAVNVQRIQAKHVRNVSTKPPH